MYSVAHAISYSPHYIDKDTKEQRVLLGHTQEAAWPEQTRSPVRFPQHPIINVSLPFYILINAFQVASIMSSSARHKQHSCHILLALS